MEESIYGKQLPELEKVKTHLMDEIDSVRNRMQAETGIDPVEHCLARIKSEDSMREKCRRKGLPASGAGASATRIRAFCAAK